MADEQSHGELDDRVGTRFGEYYIRSLVGVGGMGAVYDASVVEGARLQLGMRVALKLLKREYISNNSHRRRFRREARIAKSVRNPHVVPVLDSGEQSGIPYITQVFIDGTSLERKLRQQGRLDLAGTMRICIQVADGLEALWRAGVVHRDIKPGNILLNRSGDAFITSRQEHLKRQLPPFAL